MCTLRPATKADADSCISLLIHSDLLTTWYGANAERIMQRLFALSDNLFSHKNATVMERNDEVVGLVVDYTYPHYQTQNKATQHHIMQTLNGWAALRLRLVSSLYRVIGMKLGDINPNQHYILILHAPTEVDKNTLMDHVIEKACAAGCKQLVTDVSADDKTAIQRYERWGFQAVRRRWLLFRMEKPIPKRV